MSTLFFRTRNTLYSIVAEGEVEYLVRHTAFDHLSDSGAVLQKIKVERLGAVTESFVMEGEPATIRFWSETEGALKITTTRVKWMRFLYELGGK